MRPRSFVTAGVLLAALLPAIACGQALADEPLELRNLPPARPLPQTKPDAPAELPQTKPDDPVEQTPAPTLNPNETPVVPRLENSSPLPSVQTPQERLIIIEKETLSPNKPEDLSAQQRQETPPPAEKTVNLEKPVNLNEVTLERSDPVPDTERKEEQRAEPSTPSETPVTLEHFLLKTPEESRKTVPEASVAQEKNAPGKAEKASSRAQAQKQEKQTPAPQEKKKEQVEKKPKKTAEKGQPLRIPPEAKKKGDVSFLNGCWVGTRPEYHTKRMVREKFCFDENGVGKRFISDPAHAGECVGATRALLNRNGVLRVRSERMYCTKIKKQWGSAEMTCQGEGEHTPCTWIFQDSGGGKQSYSIRFVRE